MNIDEKKLPDLNSGKKDKNYLGECCHYSLCLVLGLQEYHSQTIRDNDGKEYGEVMIYAKWYKETFTHKKCSISVSIIDERDFEFLVPNYLVDDAGKINEEVLDDIYNKFHMGELDVNDCEEGYGGDVEVSPYSTNRVICGTTPDDEYLSVFPEGE